MANKKVNIVSQMVLLILCSLSSIVIADSYYDQHATGWHWYDDPKEEKSVKKQETPIKTPKVDPNQVIDEARKKVTTALNKVIAEPSEKNMEAFIAIQEQLNNRAEYVANLWQQVLLKHPELNYSLAHPTNNIAIKVYNEEEAKAKAQAIAAFSQQTGLFFFYRSSCSYCKRFAPIIKSFAERHHLTLVPITLDGISLPEFPDSKTDTGQAEKFHVRMTPSLFAVNPYTQKAYPVAYGLSSESDLLDNIYKIMTRDGVRK